MRKFICTQSMNGSRPAICRWAELDDKGWIDGETPIEDCGMYMVLDREITPHSAGRVFIALLGHAENEEPEVKETVTREEWLSRSICKPALLTTEEHEVYKELLK